MLLRRLWTRLRTLATVGIGIALCSWVPLAMAGEGEDMQVSPVNTSISVMLLGSIGFQMLLFYLVNWSDRDIKRYSWQVISQTISIFCAVLLFQAFNGIVEDYVMAGGSKLWEVAVDMMQLWFWLTALQVVLAVTSGAINQVWGGAPPSMEVAELRVKSWAELFAHLAGFASINAWGSLQQQIFNGSPLLAVCVVPIGWIGLFVMYTGYDTVREYIATADDGKKDEFEYLWDEEAEEVEHDIAGMSLSFLTVQAVRFHISGALPDQEGIEEWNMTVSHTGIQCKQLLGIGFLFFLLSLLPLVLEEKFKDGIHKCSHRMQELVTRSTEVWNGFFMFGNAWCFFYGVKWALASSGFTSENALLSVVLALLLSALSFMFIFILDKVVDNQLLGEDSEVADAGVEKLITALGVLVGFSWEQSFDVAVSVVSASSKDYLPPAVSKLLMSVLLVAIVFPAWRLYILKTLHDLTDDEVDEGRFLLKRASEEHRELFLDKETEEHTLDMAHLKMKQHRRLALGKPTPTQGTGLKHLRVTTMGLVEVDQPAVPSRSGKFSTRRVRLEEPLLA